MIFLNTPLSTSTNAVSVTLDQQSSDRNECGGRACKVLLPLRSHCRISSLVSVSDLEHAHCSNRFVETFSLSNVFFLHFRESQVVLPFYVDKTEILFASDCDPTWL
jgi:hypothetical protein